ncbi:NADH dehydrogenase [ubiquinone] 1 alpha subcomplex subunit 9 mitochondrial [Biomphalaria pfeifferi]|uniref:NADH dehydrogenase [ubiquinone] 1 alpha subcomplex subunit 9, mitochondrial n=1 Tax=Biomphalaria pfeifferi TaxID=112525 RepID=A0AAD8F0T4_BIOPF|nr:NADH dehydrogenase [ubiquinone] 1 alpha subcomplex subunit 9 mitochondrial [Biomphalaria pfeifferi]
MASVLVAKATINNISRQTWNQLPKAAGCIVIQQRDASSNVPTKLTAMKRGTGGRSSFSGVVATVFGANGFLGRYVCNKLGKIGSQVIIPYRCDANEVERLRLVGDLGQVLFFPFQLRDEESIRKTVQYSNVVINLIGREYETKNFKYSDVHVAGARRLARIAKESGVQTFVHVSHLNAKKDIQKVWKTSEFLKTKYESELAVREEFPEAIIFKPSDMFGAEDQFLNYFNYYSRWTVFGQLIPWKSGLPIWKNGEYTIKQPVYVADVAEGIIKAILNPDMAGQTIQCVGPQRYYLADIVDYVISILRREHGLVRTNRTFWIRLRAALLDYIPSRPWYNPDKLEREALTDWTVPGMLTLEDLGVTLTPFDDMAKFLLHPYRQYAYYQEKMGEFADPEPPKPAEFYQGKNISAS